VHPADYPTTAEAFYHAIETGASYQGVMRLRRADGEFRWHDARSEPLRDRQGRIVQWYGLAVDIDERKKAEDQLRRSEAYLAEVQRLSHTGSAVYNETALFYFSDETYRIFEFDPHEGLPSREAALEKIHPGDRDRVREEARKAVEQKKDYKLEYRNLLGSGIIKYVEANAHPKFSARGELVEIVTTIIDVTERKRGDDALRESEAKFRSAIDGIAGIVSIHYPNGEVEAVNRQCLEYFGRSLEWLKNWGTNDCVHPEDFPRVVEMFTRAMAAGIPYQIDQRLRRFDGEYRWFNNRGVPIRDDSGRVARWYVLITDIEDRKRAEEALRSAIDGIAGLVVTMAPNGELETVNRQAFEYFGRSLEELKQWETSNAVHSDDLPQLVEVLGRAIASGNPYHIDLRMRRFDGEYRWFDSRGVPICDDSGRIARWYVLATDIEERTRALAQLEQMRSDFTHMNRVSVMGELVASLSHEITQPIASARIYARAAQNFLDLRPPDLGEVREALAGIAGEAGRAGDIIDRIRDQIKKAPPRKELFDLNTAINEVIVLVRNAIIKNRVGVQTRLSEGLCPVHGDRVQLQQVVLNLFLNARNGRS
jgi:PAS domain S-box-containing protein